ncbi:MAG: hypothetical protein ACJ75J_08815 [Cytophagaceae bacterium]
MITNWRALGLCVLAACVFWFLNAMNRHKYTDDIWYPVEIAYDASKVVPVSQLPRQIKVNATGEQGEGWNFLRKAIHFNVTPVTYAPHDLPRKKYITAKELLPVAREQIEGIHINYILQDSIKIDFDYLETRKVYLKLNRASLSLAPEHNLTSPVQFKPAYVKFSGPRNLVRKLPDSILVNLNYKNIKGNFEQALPVVFKTDPSIKMEQNETVLSFKVARFFSESVSLAPEFINVPSGRIPAQTKVVLTYSVTEKDKDRFGAADFHAIADLSKVRPDNTVEVLVNGKPPGVTNVSVNPPYLKVAYEK